MIRFACPQGHQLSAGEHMAGKASKCPKCAAEFVVPAAEESAGKRSAGDAPAPRSNVFEFLCPNGHQLNGPRHLQGKAGQCPHCGARFRIPFEEEEGDEGYVTDEIPQGAFVNDDDLAGESVADEEIEAVSEFPIIDVTGGSGRSTIEPTDEQPTDDEPTDMHPLGDIFMRLWSHREPGNSLELHLIDGGKINPALFSSTLSQTEYGVFAEKQVDGTHTLITIPWDRIMRIDVRRVRDLPKDVFE